MKKPFTLFLLLGLLLNLYLFYPVISLNINNKEFSNLAKECELSKKDIASLDVVGENESIDTRVNLFMTAKANEFSCFDLELLEKKLLANRVSEKKIKYLKLKSISKDPKLVERMDSYNQ